MKLRDIFSYFIRPIILVFLAALLLDYLFNEERSILEKLQMAVILGLAYGLLRFLINRFLLKKGAKS